MALPESPVTREEMYLDAIANGSTGVPAPVTRVEQYLYTIAMNGGSGGGGGGLIEIGVT